MRSSKTTKKAVTSWSRHRPKAGGPARTAGKAQPAIKADVAIVGGGITGILSAYLLARSGKHVALFEKDLLAEGATLYTTAFLTQIIDTDYSDLIQKLGLETTRAIASSHGRAISLIEEIIETESIECEFMHCSDHIYTNKDKDSRSLREEYEAFREIGLDATFHEGDERLGFQTSGYIEVKHQAKFHPTKFLSGLIDAIRRYGGEIYEDTRVEKMIDDTTLKTTRGTVHADWIILSTYEPFNQPLRLYFKKALYTSYVCELEVKKDILREGIFEDTENPYHYFRVDRGEDFDRVIIGGEDHRTDLHLDPEKCFEALEEYIHSVFSHIPHRIVRKWHGPILEPDDGLAFIGPHTKDNILYSFGFSGNGMTYAAIAALLFFDHIHGRKNEWSKIYRTDRMPYLRLLPVKGRDYAEELIRGALKNSLAKKR